MDNLPEEVKETTKKTLLTVGPATAVGAAVGSIVPGIGTAIGAAGGVIVGGSILLVKKIKEKIDEKE